MKKAFINIEIPAPLKKKIRVLAAKADLTMAQWIRQKLKEVVNG